jgi:hypothetical protein
MVFVPVTVVLAFGAAVDTPDRCDAHKKTQISI